MDQDEALFCPGTSERSINIKFERLAAVFVDNIRFSFAVSRKSLVFKPRRIKARAISDKELPFLFCFVADESVEHWEASFLMSLFLKRNGLGPRS